MLDTMTLTKAAAGFLGAFLALLLIGWAADIIYGGSHGGHHGEQAYVIDTGEESGSGGDENVEPEINFEEVYAAADASKGEGVFRACQSCHKLDGANGTGPYLNGIVDRQIAGVADFAYSDGMAGKSSEAWTPENLFYFLEDPKGYVPGTKMSYRGMGKVEDRVNLIAYLATLN